MNDKVAIALIGIIGTITAAILSFIAARRRIRVEAISLNRKKWINTIIEKLSSFIAALECKTENREIVKLAVELQLLLPPSNYENSSAEEELANIIDIISILKEARNSGKLEFKKRDELIKEIRKALASEWKKIEQFK